MDSNVNQIIQKDGYKTALYHYYSETEPKFSIIVLHGMAEHHKRYYPFAKFLNANGIDVYLYDHRGHGTDKSMKELGFFSNSKGYVKVVDDAIEVIKYVHKNNRCNKLILMGHSMGSLIARNVICQYDDLDGTILCGTTHPSKAKIQLGLFLAGANRFFYGPAHHSNFLNNLLFGSKAYTRLISRTSFDWLSRNNLSVDAYINDPYCGFVCTSSFYHDLCKLTINASTPSLMKKTRKYLPVFIISGEQDPVGGYGNEINHLLALYHKWGYNKVEGKLYPECRHELLQELNADEVMTDILSWIQEKCG
ncbi:MAG: Hydrolase-4 domain-containing protein [Lachnoclostridium sp.]|jgi:alpha-beta hydrolase superfamily lysophospholipase